MAITNVVFADISSLSVGGVGAISGVQSLSVNKPIEVRPVYGWSSPKPMTKLAVPTLGSGSFTYIANETTGMDKDFTQITSVVATLGATEGNLFGSILSGGTVTCGKALYQGKTFSMNARGEGTVTVNFSFETLT